MTVADRPLPGPPPADPARPEPLLSVRDLHIVFRDRRGRENVAVDDFTADLQPGRPLAIVGESARARASACARCCTSCPARPP